jgi:fructokinase
MSPPPRFDLVGIGNAIVDVVASAEDDFLSRHDMHKGTMRLISAEQAEALYAAMPPGQESSGGSAANTCAVASALGAKVAFLGKVANDGLGAVFRHDITRAGVHYPTAPLEGAAPTARCLILVTPDAQRTMNTYLGACVGFDPADLDEDVIRDSSVLYLEGYLYDPPQAQAAFLRAASVAHAAGRAVALSLSDAFCVDRHRAAFRDFVRGHVDILLANEAEICSLYEVNEWDDAVGLAAAEVKLAALTRSEAGSLVVQGGERVPIPAASARVVDTTGAGDAYAAGFLTGYTKGRSLEACGQLGSMAAAAAIEQFGARPQRDLSSLAMAVA